MFGQSTKYVKKFMIKLNKVVNVFPVVKIINDNSQTYLRVVKNNFLSYFSLLNFALTKFR